MRERYDDKGNLIGCCRMVFDEIPDDYQIQKVILKDKVYDLSYLGVMKHLRDNNVAPEFSDNNFYSSEVLSHMTLDYLNSAMYLHKGIIADRGQDLSLIHISHRTRRIIRNAMMVWWNDTKRLNQGMMPLWKP